MISLADMAIDNKNNPIADLNKKLHSSKAYNIFQTGTSEGTLVSTISGRCAIDKINVGDKVLSANPETLDKKYKCVEKVFRRKVKKLIHLVVDDEELVTTENHPFYVMERGFL